MWNCAYIAASTRGFSWPSKRSSSSCGTRSCCSNFSCSCLDPSNRCTFVGRIANINNKWTYRKGWVEMDGGLNRTKLPIILIFKKILAPKIAHFCHLSLPLFFFLLITGKAGFCAIYGLCQVSVRCLMTGWLPVLLGFSCVFSIHFVVREKLKC